MLMLSCSIPLWCSWSRCRWVRCWHWVASVVEVVLWSRWARLLSWLGQVVACCCHAHTCWHQTPSWRMIFTVVGVECWLQKLCQITNNWCFLFPRAGQIVCIVAWGFPILSRVDAVCILLLLILWWCWSAHTSGCCPTVSTVLLLQVLRLQLVSVVLWLVVVIVQPVWTCVGRMDHVDPCMLRTCMSILRMCCSCRRMLVVVAWVCVFVWCHLLCLHHVLSMPCAAILLFVCKPCWSCTGCCIQCPALLSRVFLLPGIKPSFFCCVCVAVAWRCPGEAELRYHVKMAAHCWTCWLLKLCTVAANLL